MPLPKVIENTVPNRIPSSEFRVQIDDDRSFIVLTETKFSFRCIPVWDRYSPHRTRVEKKTHGIISHHDLTGTLVTPLLLGRTRWSTKSPTCLPLSVFTSPSDQH